MSDFPMGIKAPKWGNLPVASGVGLAKDARADG